MIQINNISFSKKTIESIQIDNDDVKGVEVELQKTNLKITIIKNSNETIKEEINEIDYKYEEPKEEQPEPEQEDRKNDEEPEPEEEPEPKPDQESRKYIIEYLEEEYKTTSTLMKKLYSKYKC